jgi:hypothetical protein
MMWLVVTKNKASEMKTEANISVLEGFYRNMGKGIGP